MYADDFDDEKNGGESHPQEEEVEDPPTSEPVQNLAQASKAKAALEKLQAIEDQQKAEEDAKK